MRDRSTTRVIRLALRGCTNRPFYHIVLAPNRRPRSFEAEQIGSYDPLPNIHQERLVAINFDRLNHHIRNGVRISKPVAKLLGYAGYLPVHYMSYADAAKRMKSEKEALMKDMQEQANNETEETQS